MAGIFLPVAVRAAWWIAGSDNRHSTPLKRIYQNSVAIMCRRGQHTSACPCGEAKRREGSIPEEGGHQPENWFGYAVNHPETSQQFQRALSLILLIHSSSLTPQVFHLVSQGLPPDCTKTVVFTHAIGIRQ